MYYEWIHSLSTLQTWLLAAGVNVVLWFVLVMPLLYRLYITPFTGETFTMKMQQQPRVALLTIVFHLVLGIVMIYPGILALGFVVMGVLFRVVWSVILPKRR